MSKYRSLQFLRNETINSYASHEKAIEAIKGYTPENGEAVPSVLANVDAKDGEIIMFRYKLEGDGNTVHTQLVAARRDGSAKYFEIVANYDQLTNIIEHLNANVTGRSATEGAYVTVNVVEENGVITAVNVTENIDERIAEEIAKLDATVRSTDGVNVQVQVVETDGKITDVSVSDNSINATDLKNAIEALDADKSGSNANQDITVQVVETNGKITDVKVSDTLKSVAHTGAAADVAVAAKTDAQGNTVVAEGTVQGTLEAIAAKIDGMDSAYTPGTLVKVDFTQVDGKVTVFTTDETALEERLEAIENNTIIGDEAIVVTPDAEGNNVVTLKLADETILTQDDNGLKATLSIVYNSDDKQIELHGVNGIIGNPIDATDFIKDGMLEDAEIITATTEEGLEAGKRYIKFTFKTYQQGQEGVEEILKVEYLDVESLFDSYTADEQWIHIDQDANKISHITSGVTAGDYAVNANDVTVNSTTSQSFKVPTLTVDAAGHVTAASEKTVTISLPASIDTAVQTINGHAENASFITTTVTPSNNNTVQDIAVTAKLGTFAANEANLVNGLATVQAVTDYVQANSTTVSDVATNPVSVESTTNANGSKDYKVTLDAVEVENEDVTNTMANDTATHSYITSIETDGFGRVVKTVTETMTEDIDCGCWDA